MKNKKIKFPNVSDEDLKFIFDYAIPTKFMNGFIFHYDWYKLCLKYNYSHDEFDFINVMVPRISPEGSIHICEDLDVCVRLETLWMKLEIKFKKDRNYINTYFFPEYTKFFKECLEVSNQNKIRIKEKIVKSKNSFNYKINKLRDLNLLDKNEVLSEDGKELMQMPELNIITK